MTSTERTTHALLAKRAYELGRLRVAARAALFVLLLPAAAYLLGGMRSTLSMYAALLLPTLVLGLRFIGRGYDRAIGTGLLAGSAPLLLPLLLRGSGHCCVAGACLPVCMVGCICGGLIAGAMIGRNASRITQQRGAFLATATLLASASGVLGCAVVGVAGISGMLLGVVSVSLPVAFMRSARA